MYELGFDLSGYVEGDYVHDVFVDMKYPWLYIYHSRTLIPVAVTLTSRNLFHVFGIVKHILNVLWIFLGGEFVCVM